MNRYIIQYHSRTLAALAHRDKQQRLPASAWLFNYAATPDYEIEIALHDKVKNINDTKLHTGLGAIASIRTSSEEQAIEISKNHVEALLNLICFSTIAHCAPAKLVSVIDLAGKEAHPCKFYAYPFDDQEIMGSLALIDETTFGKIFEAYDESTYKPRLLRALAWLRKGIGEETTMDEFVSYWIGLEVVKHIISSDKTRTDVEWRKIEEIFTDKLHFQNFQKIKKAGRNGLLHGFRQLDEKFAKELSSYIEPIRKTLIFCIGSTLGLEDSNILSIASKNPKRIRWNPWAIMKGQLKNLPTDFKELVAAYPTLDIETTDRELSVSQGGELTIKYSVTHRFHSTGNTKLELGETELWGDKDIGITRSTISIK